MFNNVFPKLVPFMR